MEPQLDLIHTERGSFEVRTHGDIAAPLVVALHGFPDIAATFDGLAAALVHAGFHVVAPLLRGYAPSVTDMPPDRSLFDTLANDALAIVDAKYGDRPFAVVGHDNGAFATYSLLRIAGPRITAAVTLAAGHPAAVFTNTGKLPRQMWRSRYAMLFQIPGIAEWWASRRNFAYLDTLWRRWAAPAWTPPAGHLAAVKAVMARSWPAPLLQYRAMPFGGDETRLVQPTLYLLGGSDGCVTPEAAVGQERYFSGPFKAEIVDGAGHFLHLEQPERVLPRIVCWLERYGRGGGPATV